MTEAVAAMYARYSTDLQNDKSVEDQILLCHQIAKRHGFTVRDDLIFFDRAKSGAGLKERYGMQDLLAAAKERRFQVVIAEDTNRLSRDDEGTAHIRKRMAANNIKIVVNDGEQNDIMLQVKALVSVIQLKQTADQVRRHHNSRAAEGIACCAPPYGYEKDPDGEKGAWRICTAEAVIIRRIFTEYASGKSPMLIAADLTRDDIPNPSGGKAWNWQAFTHGRGSERGMIGNELYVGMLVWGRYYTIKDPDSERRVRRRQTDPDRITRTPVPHLRIISDELWQRAHAVCDARANKQFGPSMKRPAISTRASKDSLLAGMLVCEACGGHMRITKSRQEKGRATGSVGARVACTNSVHKGICAHRKSYDLAELERLVLRGAKKHMTDPEALLLFTETYHKRLIARQHDANGDLDRAYKDRKDISLKCECIVTAIEEGGDLSILMTRLKTLDHQLKALETKIEMLERETKVVTVHPASVKNFAVSMRRLAAVLLGEEKVDDLEPFKLTFRNVFECFIVHETAPRADYEVTPKWRHAASLGIELFFASETPEQMLENHGHTAPLNPTKGAHGYHEWSSQDAVISLGRWRQAA